MLFDLTFPCYLTTFSGEKCLNGNLVCAFYCPAYRSSPVWSWSYLLLWGELPAESAIDVGLYIFLRLTARDHHYSSLDIPFEKNLHTQKHTRPGKIDSEKT
jgi:hypothetical protein